MPHCEAAGAGLRRQASTVHTASIGFARVARASRGQRQGMACSLPQLLNRLPPVREIAVFAQSICPVSRLRSVAPWWRAASIRPLTSPNLSGLRLKQCWAYVGWADGAYSELYCTARSSGAASRYSPLWLYFALERTVWLVSVSWRVVRVHERPARRLPHTPPLLPLSRCLVCPQVTPEAIASLKRTGCGIKGEFVTGVGKGTLPSVNIELRKSMKVRGAGGQRPVQRGREGCRGAEVAGSAERRRGAGVEMQRSQIFVCTDRLPPRRCGAPASTHDLICAFPPASFSINRVCLRSCTRTWSTPSTSPASSPATTAWTWSSCARTRRCVPLRDVRRVPTAVRPALLAVRCAGGCAVCWRLCAVLTAVRCADGCALCGVRYALCVARDVRCPLCARPLGCPLAACNTKHDSQAPHAIPQRPPSRATRTRQRCAAHNAPALAAHLCSVSIHPP